MWVQDVRKGWIMAAGLVSLIAGGAAVAAGTGSQGGNGQTGQGATGTNDSEFNQPDARDRTGSDDRRGAGEEIPRHDGRARTRLSDVVRGGGAGEARAERFDGLHTRQLRPRHGEVC